ncbi:CoA transferase [Sphingobium amiense]|uniref:CoA transferase n=1 Tax=Sphingobium amiense TaxID=135719 RepID=A0A494W784_9SPHN|nr:CoA transferase [Sphingobium amiense]BBD98407.1 CoA transferase [Sphingobium amiense]
MAGTGPLQGIRILDLSTVLMGPYASLLLAQMGADVIKVEAPEGDIVRLIGKARNPGMSGIYLTANRGKRSIVLDLKQPQDREELLLIAQTCDVMLYNLRPQAMARLGLAYEDVAAVKPDIIYVGTFGYGEDGPYAGKPAYDDLIQGASGAASLSALVRPGAAPAYLPIAIADRMVGIHAVNAILAALVHRERTGEGQRVDVPMFETMVSVVLGDHMAGLTFDPPLDDGGYARLLAPDRKPMQTSDGHVCVLIYNDKQWKRFFEMLGRDDAQTDPRLQNQSTRTTHIAAIYADLAQIFLTKTTAEWMALLEKADIPVMPLHDLQSLLDDPHLAATGFFEQLDHPSEGRIRGMRIPSRWSATQPGAPGPAPRLNEHGDEIRREARQMLAARSADPVLRVANGGDL